MNYEDLISALGYKGSPLFSEERDSILMDISDRHWVRAAFDAGVQGSYFFKTRPPISTEESSGQVTVRPAVYVAKVDTEDEARAIHKKLWNQGLAPFLIIVLPAQIRVYTGFAYHPNDPEIGKVLDFINDTTVENITQALETFTADAINRGEIWQRYADKLTIDGRVDTTLLAQLDKLGKALQKTPFSLPQKKTHALIGKFVYLSYLRARGILSDKWLSENGISPQTLFNGTVFSPTITKKSFRHLVKAVETKFNGQLFPIAWGSNSAPKADDILLVAKVFSGNEDIGGQINFPFLAYDFANIPVEFISTIYEQFLHDTNEENEQSKKKSTEDASDPEKNGAHYTPEPLADYLAAEINSIRVLEPRMKVLDPCCGSGIFLVIAFRRMVEMECNSQQREFLPPSELRELLVSSIYGVERNEIAAQISIFSLILVLLNYVDPPELHRHPKFKFPTLSNGNIFVGEDFFDDSNAFWEQVNSAVKPLHFDWIIGNPPWVEINPDDIKESYFVKWYRKNEKKYQLVRYRTGEAFAWRIIDCLAQNGVAGLILHAKTLTNDQLVKWRKYFFNSISVRRLSNLSNLKQIIFSVVKHPIITLVYTHKNPSIDKFLHIAPFLANRIVNRAFNEQKKRKQQAWSIGFSESEVKWISAHNATNGDAMTWKMALWGNTRDVRAIQQLRHCFSNSLGNLVTLGDLAVKHNWNIALGLQLKGDQGTERNPYEYEKSIENLELFDHKSFIRHPITLEVQDAYFVKNTIGCFIKKGSRSGLKIISGPRLFLWQDFASYMSRDAIIQHSKVAIGHGSEKEMKAIAVVWNSHFISYFLFFILSSEWGIGYNLIDKHDVDKMPFPEFSDDQKDSLANAWEIAKTKKSQGVSFEEIREYFDSRIAQILHIPETTTLIVQEFFKTRYLLNNGKNPPELNENPDEPILKSYAERLRNSLDAYLEKQVRHKIRIIYSDHVIAVSITLTSQNSIPIPIEIVPASKRESQLLKKLLEAAETKFSQWIYVRKNMFIKDSDTFYLLKPSRLLEWTQTQALLDSSDIIAEITQEAVPQ
jgi:hypothetical protein